MPIKERRGGDVSSCPFAHYTSPQNKAPRKTNLLGKINLGTLQLGLKVVRIPRQKNKSSTKQTNKDGSSLILGRSNRVHISILTNDLDPLHKVTPTVIGVLDRSGEASLTLGRCLVELFTTLLDLIGILLVVVVVLVNVLGFLAGHALGADQGGGGVGHGCSVGKGGVGGGTVVGVGKDGTFIVGEETHADSGSIIGTVGSHEVLDLFTSIVVVIVVVLSLKLLTLGHLPNILLLLLLSSLLGIGIILDTVLHTLIHVTIVLTHLLGVIVIPPIGTVTLVVHGILTIVLLILLDRLKVGIEVGIHAHDIITISRLAPVRTIGRTVIGRAKTESHQRSVGNTHIIFIIGILIPSGDVVTSLEFEGVVGDPGVVDFAIVALEGTLGGGGVDAASGGEEGLAHFGVGGDVGGCGEAEDCGEGG
mmetsp:Transcript_16119/g.32343  ORF Transcript_16119/g.32343 Transcript_16119/m.32343 type:complete len:420 (+) Transcript_16119:97-1356(+)